MKKYILTILSLVFVSSGCITANQKEVELKYYETQQAIIQHEQQQESMPLFEIVSQDSNEPMIFQNVSSIRVFQPNIKSDKPVLLPQYKQKDYMAPWIGLLSKGISIGIPAYAAYKTIDSLAKNAGDTYSNSGEGNFTAGDTSTTNSGGDLNIAGDTENYSDSLNEGSFNDSVKDSYADGTWDSHKDNTEGSYTDGTWDSNKDNIEESYKDNIEDSYADGTWDSNKDNIEGSYTDGTWDSNKDNTEGSYTDGTWDSTIEDSTHTPTVVEQPDYNEPIIVEQPDYNEPIIVEQPDYNEPIIVEQPEPIIINQNE